jgi:Holliday junction resolvase RusA-like endonuclease
MPTPYIAVRIEGVPYSKSKHRGAVLAPGAWTTAVRDATRCLPKIKEACILKITFMLPANKFPPNFPFGPDLDNLFKRFLDALNDTVFSDARGKDSCVVSLHVMKTRVETAEESGAHIEILPITIV